MTITYVIEHRTLDDVQMFTGFNDVDSAERFAADQIDNAAGAGTPTMVTVYMFDGDGNLPAIIYRETIR